MTEGNDSAPGIGRVAVKPPPFWPDRPALWFAQLDSQFILASIKCDDTKFHYAISVLDFKYAAAVEEIITKPPETDKYETLKRELISRLSASRGQRLQQLLCKEELGDRKPSEFLRYLRGLAGSDVSDELMRPLWSNRLPTYLQTVIAMQPEEAKLDNLAQMADKVFEVTPHACLSVSAASTSSVPASTKLDELERKIDGLAGAVEALTMQQGRSRRSQPQDVSRKRRSRSRSRDHFGRECWYHWKYGEKADRCVPPCEYSKNL